MGLVKKSTPKQSTKTSTVTMKIIHIKEYRLRGERRVLKKWIGGAKGTILATGTQNQDRRMRTEPQNAAHFPELMAFKNCLFCIEKRLLIISQWVDF